MFESLWIGFQVKIVPFLPQLFTFAIIAFPVTFLALINNEPKTTQQPEQHTG